MSYDFIQWVIYPTFLNVQRTGLCVCRSVGSLGYFALTGNPNN